MALSPNSIVTPQTPRSAVVVTTTANTTLTSSPTNTAVAFTAGANGSRITKVTSTPRATVTATGLRAYLSTDGGTTKTLLTSVLMSAHTVANTTAIPVTDWGFSEENPLILPANAILYLDQAVSLSDGIAHFVMGADY